jgi:cubilin
VSANNKDGFECICKQGWRKANDSQACTQDVDECMEMRPHCSVDPKVICINTPGSFVCGPCPDGYTGNGFYCQDINECEINNGGCSVAPKVACINSRVNISATIQRDFTNLIFILNKQGSYHCGNCPLGYEGDGRICNAGSSQPNNLECSDSSICNVNARCYQYVTGAQSCVCRPGYSGSGYGENGCVAVALDPCANLRCKSGGTCVRNGTTAFCQCPQDTAGPFCDRINNPCSPNPCRNNGICNRVGM